MWHKCYHTIFLVDTEMEAFKSSIYTHWAKTKEGTGTPSVLISCCCCVLEGVQGSAVIGLFSYWGIQSRARGYRSERSDPRVPLPAFHPRFLPSSPLPTPGIQTSTGKTCRTWQAWRLDRGHGDPFSGRGSKSTATKRKNLESRAPPQKNRLPGTRLGESVRMWEWWGRTGGPWKRCQDFLQIQECQAKQRQA